MGWLAQLDAPNVWLGLDQDLDNPDSWTASNLVDRLLFQDFNSPSLLMPSAAHKKVTEALKQICHVSGLTTHRRNIPSVQKANGKTGRGDLLLKDANVGGALHLVIDMYGDHIHTCQQHTGSTKDAHETILDALEQICHDSGLTTHRRNIPSVQKANGRTGR